jgi:spermidine synthase
VLFFSALLLGDFGKRIIVFFLILIAVLAFKMGRVDEYLEKTSLSQLWRGLPIVKSVDSIYGNLAVLKTAEQISFYENGLILFSYPDEFSSEEAVLYAIAQHPDPKNLLLIGGGVGGALTQALKSRDLKIDYVELDPEIVKLGEAFLPISEVKSIEDSRVRIIHKDGRLFVREEYKQGRGKYDLVILNLPDPYNAQLNRFYTKEFFSMVKNLLGTNGIFSFRVSSAENYLGSDQALYLSSIYRTLSSEFEKVTVLPGANSVFLASQTVNPTNDWMQIVESLNQKKIQTTFVNEHFLRDRLSPERVEYLNRMINYLRGKINYDLKPISYFYNTVLWSTQLKSFEKPIFVFLSRLNSAWYFALGFLGTFIPLFFILRNRNFLPGFSLSAIFLTGFTSIAFEVILLLTYQIFYGYIYSQIGIFLTLFMLGLFAGAFYISRKRTKPNFTTLARLQFLQVALLLLFLAFISFLLKSYFNPRSLGIILGALIFSSGFIGGALFTAANQIYVEKKGIKRAGTGYSIDLLGSALSSILASVILIPLIGIPLTLWLFLLLNLILLGFLTFSLFKTRIFKL